MPPIVKNLFLSKPFVVALLTAAGAVAAYEGWNVDVTKLLLFISPFLIMIGASDWSEAAEKKAQIEQETALKLHLLSKGVAPHELHDAMKSMTRPTPVKATQAGFSRVSVMFIIAALSAGTVAVLSASSCSSTPPNIVSDVIDCAKAEGQSVTSGFSIIQIVNTVIGVVSGKPMAGCETAPNVIECDVEKLALQFGGDIVACVIDSIPEPAPGSGEKESLVVLNKHKALPLAAKGKKIVHSYQKGSN